ncbi:elongin-B [Caerostris darwini]|uniref:Elongin-B n=2 Tax=Caerostris TaxID=172845 RepID=A0AAV4PDT3_9ARAC|nr:elongin-B [Caerostris extrusa]GIX95281.1 elongin-B [Caerostris darwini]
MDVFLMVRRKKTTIFLDAKENTTVYELKKMIEGITKVPPENQELFREEAVMESHKILGEYGLNCTTAKAQAPAQVGLAYRDIDSMGFESLEITPLSNPPELPDVMKPPEAQGHEQTMA